VIGSVLCNYWPPINLGEIRCFSRKNLLFFGSKPVEKWLKKGQIQVFTDKDGYFIFTDKDFGVKLHFYG
jgi:hypothetical protein